MTPAVVAERVERARDGSVPASRRHAAFEELARSFETMAFGSAFRLLHHAEDARDATQDAFLAAWLKLDQLRTPAAFGGWLRRLVATECRRRLRDVTVTSCLDDRSIPREATVQETPSWSLARMSATLTEPERQVIVLFYVLGCTLHEIAAIVGAPPPTIGKRLYAARLKVRRALPPSVRASVMRLRAGGLRSGPDTLAEYVGVYRFEQRPELVVEIKRSRRGDLVASDSQGQRNVLHPIGEDTLVTQSFDGEGRFQRDEGGRITRFVYYEFGARLGVATRIADS